MALKLNFKKKKNTEVTEEDLELDGLSSEESSDEAVSSSFSKDKNGVVSANGTDYAVGIFWNSVSELSKAASEAKDAAKNPNIKADFYCVRGDNIPQYGLGFVESGHKAGMPLLASTLNDAIEGNWIGVFSVGENYYLAAVRDESVLSDYDRVFTDEDEAREEFSDLFYASSWDHAYCPSDWCVEDTEERTLDSLLFNSPTVKLKEVNTLKVAARYGAIGAVVLGVLYGGMLTFQTFFDNTNIEQVTAIYNQVQTRVIDQVGGAEKEVEVKVNPPWLGKATGVSLLGGCVKEIRDMPISAPGWKAKEVLCNDFGVSLLLERDGGTINWIGSYFNEQRSVKPSIIPLNDDNVEVTYPVTIPTTYPELVETYPLAQVQRYLYSHFDEGYLSIQMKTASLDEVQAFVDNPASHRFYEALKFEFSAGYLPTEFTQIFSRIPVFTIEDIRFNVDSNVWTVKGDIYDKRIEPLPAEDF